MKNQTNQIFFIFENIRYKDPILVLVRKVPQSNNLVVCKEWCNFVKNVRVVSGMMYAIISVKFTVILNTSQY